MGGRVTGSNGNDNITTGAGDDVVWANGGNDSVSLGDGNDEAGGGAGNDTIRGQGGNDMVWGDDGNDLLYGDSGNDTVGGGAGDDTMDGGTGDDHMGGGDGHDLIYGGDGNDAIGGDGGNDTIHAGEGSDSVGGGAGDDVIYGEAGDDQLGGEAGNDTVSGGKGNDGISGGDGNDLLDGGYGNDSMGGGAGNDTLYGDDGDDHMGGDDGNDLLYGGAGNDQMGGDAGDDTVDGGEGADRLWGGAGRDDLRGGAGQDTLEGGADADVMTGGTEADVFIIPDGTGNDTVTDFDVHQDIIAFDMAEIQRFADVTSRTAQDGRDTVFTFDNGDTLRLLNVSRTDLRPSNVQSVNGPICLCAGTPVATPRGAVAVEDLRPGDLVLTLDGPPLPVQAMIRESHRFRRRDDRARPILVAEGALGANLPRQALRLSPQHRVLLRDPSSGAEYLVAAVKLTDRPGIRRMGGVSGADYHNILLDRHAVISAADLPVESLLVTERSRDRLPPAEQLRWRDVPNMQPARPIRKSGAGLTGQRFAAPAHMRTG